MLTDQVKFSGRQVTAVGRGPLELEAKSQLNPSRITHGANPHEVRIGESGNRVAPPGVVQYVLRLGAELDPITANRHPSEQAQVEVVLPRPAELVAARVPPLVAWLG